ncbi:hypothetical protein LYNGBM3L_51500 [Moorena producens 3L]|uniref:Serine protease n=3 Tax=Coleofasciculaceae TaxID=1892251 RepID=F4XYB1_9CYAN|nr:hypothetical protein LYNGBM3L_51500 [Moorena producens 3L]
MTTVVIGNYSGTFEEEDSYGNVNCTEPKIIKNIDKKKKQIKENQASGVIIAKRNNTFYVLTNQHVLEKGADCYGIVVWDGDKHSIHFSKDSDIQYIDKKEFGQGVDLALIKFQGYSSNQYYVASLKDSNTIPDSGQLFVSGWPTPPEDEKTSSERKFLSANIFSNFPPETVSTETFLCPDKRGYKLCYFSKVRKGMSGGPIFDANGYVVGIHGRGNSKYKGSGIPITEFIYLINQNKSTLSKNDLNFKPPSQDLIAKGRENARQADTIEDLYELFLGCLIIERNELSCITDYPSDLEWNDKCK